MANNRCVILGRSKKSEQWNLIVLSEFPRAWRFANSIVEQEQLLGNKYETIVVSLENYENQNIRPEKPPHGFDLRLPGQSELAVPAQPQGGYKQTPCIYCQALVPSNGGAQFSHIKKHLKELIASGELTQAKADSVRSTKLQPDIIAVFKKVYKTKETVANG